MKVDYFYQWLDRANEVAAKGERPMFAALCPDCYKRVPVEERPGFVDVADCQCGLTATREELNLALVGVSETPFFRAPADSNDLTKVD